MNKPEMLIVHHSGGTDANPLADTSHHTIEQVRAWHLAKGWDDIGYNWFIEKDGKVKKGRDEKIQGAHTVGYNTKSIGVCFAGNFDATYPTKEQEEGFKFFYRELVKRYSNITPDKVYPHRKFAVKTCYGNKLGDEWASKLAQKALEDGKPEVKDDSKEALEYCKKENTEMKGIFSVIHKLISKFIV